MNLDNVNGAGAIHRHVVRPRRTELPLHSTGFAEHTQYLSVETQFYDPAIGGVTHIERVFLRHVMKSPRSAHFRPFTEKFAVSVKDLNPLVRTVSHVNAALAIESYIVRKVKLAIACPLLAQWSK